MNLKARRRYDMLVRVKAFGAKRARTFPQPSLAGQAFATVARVISELSEHSAVRLSADGRLRERTVKKAVARQRLRESLRAIHAAARAMAIDSPGLDRKFRPPRSVGEHVLLGAAAGVLQHAREQKATFIAHGLPARFLEDLAGDVERLERASLNRSLARGEWLSPRVRMQAALRDGLTAVRRLDGIVPNVLRGKHAALAAWRSARRVGRRGRRVASSAASRRTLVLVADRRRRWA